MTPAVRGAIGFGVLSGGGLWGSLRACVVALGLTACSAPVCKDTLYVTLAKHPEGKPKPAALVLARCTTKDGPEQWQWLCDDVTATAAGVVCDGKTKAAGK